MPPDSTSTPAAQGPSEGPSLKGPSYMWCCSRPSGTGRRVSARYTLRSSGRSCSGGGSAPAPVEASELFGVQNGGELCSRAA
eukprot:365096-Chlamydomonas_euryale.AAC.11